MIAGSFDLKEFLDEKAEKYNRPTFTETDPIQVPRQFIQKENTDIAAFLTATISWGNRPAIIKNALRMMALMDNRPYEFILNATPSDLKSFKHGT